jgi:ABC-type antimicrobial peptide transport system permease subunit
VQIGAAPTIRQNRSQKLLVIGLVQLYFPAAQDPNLQVRMLVRTNGEPNTFLRSIRDAVHATDPEIPVFEAQTMTDAVSAALAPQRLAMNLISVFSLLALALAVFGLYALLTQIVSQRTREIGVRMALGSSRSGVLGLILTKGMLLVGLGLALGLVAETSLAPLFHRFLYQVTPTDLTTLLLTTALIGIAAFFACLAPALRAANLDPIEAIRER